VVLVRADTANDAAISVSTTVLRFETTEAATLVFSNTTATLPTRFQVASSIHMDSSAGDSRSARYRIGQTAVDEVAFRVRNFVLGMTVVYESREPALAGRYAELFRAKLGD
jgi:hypothetical protein